MGIARRIRYIRRYIKNINTYLQEGYGKNERNHKKRYKRRMGAFRHYQGRRLLFLNYCVGNVGGTVEEQINGAFDEMERRLALFGLNLENVVQMDCLFRDVWNIPIMEKVIKERFNGRYPVRKSIQTGFAHVGGESGLQFQADAVAYCGEQEG